MTGQADAAQDLVQETFLRAWRAFRTFDPAGNARAWLYKILLRLHLDARRRQRAQPAADLTQADAVDDLYLYRRVVEVEGLREAGNPETAFFDSLVGGEVRAALPAVPPVHRRVILLAAEGFTYREIADVLDIPVGTVMSRLHRARALLQKSLWDYCVQIGRCRPGPPAAPLSGPCADACHSLYRYLDGALEGETLRAVQAHLSVCRQCCSRLEFQRRLEMTVRAELGRRRLPRHLKARILRLIRFL
jgi:RNA polymerase sigma-70 factor (ECF subfamily)